MTPPIRRSQVNTNQDRQELQARFEAALRESAIRRRRSHNRNRNMADQQNPNPNPQQQNAIPNPQQQQNVNPDPNANQQVPNPQPQIPAELLQQLDGIDPAHLQIINNFIQAQRQNQNARIHENYQRHQPYLIPQRQNITVLQSTVEKPKYKPDSQTAQDFLLEVETYFATQNIHQEHCILVFRSMLSDEGKSWFDNWKFHEGRYTWADMKYYFTDKYDTWFERNERERTLHTKTQGEDEAVSTFIWEMVRLSRMVYPNEQEQVTVQRCRQALLPRIRVGLGTPRIWTIDSLIKDCEVIMSDLKDLDSSEKRRNSNPNNTVSYGNNGNYRGNNYRGNFRGRGYYRNNYRNYNRSYYNNYNHNNGNREEEENSRQPQNSARGNNNSNTNRGNNNTRGNNNYQRGNNNSNGNGNRGNQNNSNYRGSNSRPYNRGNNNYNSNRGGRGNTNNNVVCYKCQGFGHFANVCSSNRGFINMIRNSEYEDIENREEREREQPNEERPSSSLNSRGNVSSSPRRTYSQF